MVFVLAPTAVVAAFVGTWFHLLLTGSLPQLDGEQVLEGLSAQVTVERDALGVPTISGANRIDIARAAGFLHAQERFFQMDLWRRRAAGELAELLGVSAIEADRATRVHRFRMRAREVIASLPRQDRALIEAYAAGVNAGLTALNASPFEYLILRDEPDPWRPEDSILVVYAMYLKLQNETWSQESMYGVMNDILPAPLYEFLAPHGTEWDTPIDGEPLGLEPAIPGPETFNLREQPRAAHPTRRPINLPENARQEMPLGSNSWAVAGHHTVHGRALLANDMHLDLSVPNTWYRLSIIYPDGQDRTRRVTGISLPGLPVVVVGSNENIAWGFTNSYIDWSDLVILESAPGDHDAYLAPAGPHRFERYQETIQVKDGDDRTLEINYTVWGPVIDIDHRSRQRALRWVAHDRDAVNLKLMRLETADTVEEAIEIANRTGAPAQNFVVVDTQGHIGWTILGPVPRRYGHDGRLPQSWADGTRGWNGWLRPVEYPRIIDPKGGRLWTANARVVGGEMLAKLGDGGYELGARAHQIRKDLFALQGASEADMLAVQLDDRAEFLARWQKLLLEVLTPTALAADPRRRELREHVENWGGRAAIDSVGYYIVRTFRLMLEGQVFQSLTTACRIADPRFDYDWIMQAEGPLWRLVREQPLHLLDPRFKTWQSQFLAAVDDTLNYLLTDESALEDHTWGAHNTVEIRHPLSPFIPGSSRWLDMPAQSLPGDFYMPRVQQGPASGASQRMVVSPGLEAEGIFHMPGGQSGHPLSPHYRNAHKAWVEGEATLFLPGPARHTLVLLPGKAVTRP